MTETIHRGEARNAVADSADEQLLALLDAGEIVLTRLGPEGFSLGDVAKVAWIPLPRIYQRFADKNALLGALSSRQLSRLSRNIDNANPLPSDWDQERKLLRIIGNLTDLVESQGAFLVLCGPFDQASRKSRLSAICSLARAFEAALDNDISAGRLNLARDALDYAAELVFSFFRRGFETEGRIGATAINMAERAVIAFIAPSSQALHGAASL